MLKAAEGVATSTPAARPADTSAPLRATPAPLVSVLVPCRNEVACIEKCLDSILANDYPRESIEILVIDGLSDDGTEAILRVYAEADSRVRVLTNPQRVVPHALNLGLRRAAGEIIMRMDAHAKYPPHYISALVGWLLRTDADNVGSACVTLPENGTAQARAIAVALAHPFGVGDARFRLGTTEPRWVDTVPFGCFRRDVFERIGGFDEELARNQDDEFNHRLLKSGGKILLVPGVVAHYYARGSLRQLARMYFQYGYLKPLVARKVGRVMTRRQLIPAVLVTMLLLSGVLALWFPLAKAAFAGVLGVYGVANVTASAVAARRHGFRVGLWLAAAFPAMHLSYGVGFLWGVLDFWLLARRRLRPLPLSR